MLRRSVLVALAGWLAGWLGGCAAPPLEHASPLRVRNQHPAQLTAVHAGPRSPRPIAAGHVEAVTGLDWTSLWLLPGAGPDRIELDGEIVRIVPRWTVGLGGGFDVSIEVPAVHAGGGVLDGFIESWHEFLVLPQNRRDEFPRGRFDARAERDVMGRLVTAYELDEVGLGLADVPVELTFFPIRSGDTGITLGLRAGVELPAGSESRGLGNGELDAMLGFVAGWTRPRWAMFAWGGWGFVGTPETARRAGVSYADRPSAGAGVELALLDGLSGVAQVEWERSVLADLDNAHAKSSQALLWLGGRLRFGEAADVELAVGEDLIRDVSPDVTFHLALRLRL